MKVTAMIMAGGRGERFWPKSRKNLPKQFLSLTDDGITMIQHTVNRIQPLVDMEDIYIVTNRDYKALAKEQLPDLPEENILCEPVGRNTAPCVGLAAMHINKKYDDALMIVLPSDHLIKYNSMFVDVLKDACQVAEKGSNLTTIGITPNYPETGYGYIKFDPDQSVGRAYGVECFVEKPNLKKAKEYLGQADFIIYVVDASIPLDEADHKIIDLLSDKKGVILKNKSDLEKNLDDKELEQKLHWDCIDFSSKTTKGLSKLEKYITDSFLEGNISYNDQIYLTSVRHRDAVEKAVVSLKQTMQTIEDGMPEDLFIIDMMDAYEKLGLINGETASEDLVNKIFKEFCMGK